MSEMTVVAPLHKTKSKFDFVYKGKTLHFEIDPQADGVLVAFVTDVKLREVIPEHLQSIMARGQDLDDVVGRKAISQKHIKLHIWEKIFGITLEKKVSVWAKRTQEEYRKSEDIAEKIRSFVNQ